MKKMNKAELDDMFDFLCPEAYEREQEIKRQEANARALKKLINNIDLPAYSADHFQMYDESIALDITIEGRKNLKEVYEETFNLHDFSFRT